MIVVKGLPTTGWRRLIGCLKLQVIFRKRATNYRALLWEMTYKDRHPMGLRHPVQGGNNLDDALSMEVNFRKRAL